MNDLVAIVKNLGLSDKASRVYLACLELGEATVLALAKRSGVKRTSIYYVLDELKEHGAILETKRNKRIFYLPESPDSLLKKVRERLWGFEQSVDRLEEKRHSVYRKPRLYFLYGPSGFKQIWELIFQDPKKEYRIITEAIQFQDFVKEKYIIDEIINTKKKLGIKSRQLIRDSALARKIVAKDSYENRVSKLLPSSCTLPFTEIITSQLVAFISPRWNNTLFVVENELFAETRKSIFDATWQKLS